MEVPLVRTQRGPFESSPSRPDPNGVSHPSPSAQSPPESVFLRRVRPASTRGHEPSGADRLGVAGVFPMSSSIGKRQREQQKLERAELKAQRRAVRQAAGAEDGPPAGHSGRSQPELIDDLRILQQRFGDGEISAEDFAEYRDQIQAQLERLSS